MAYKRRMFRVTTEPSSIDTSGANAVDDQFEAATGWEALVELLRHHSIPEIGRVTIIDSEVGNISRHPPGFGPSGSTSSPTYFNSELRGVDFDVTIDATQPWMYQFTAPDSLHAARFLLKIGAIPESSFVLHFNHRTYLYESSPY